VPYLPEEQARFWDSTLSRFIPDDTQRAFLQRLSGAILVRGGLREQILPFFSGSGANGKSTVVHGLRTALGASLAIEVDPATLRPDKRAGAAPSPDKIRLRGARFVYAVEASGSLDAELLKRLTGGEEIVARQLHGKTIAFKPSFTLAIVANSAPELDDTSEGLWRRLMVIPFSVRVPDSERIDALTVEQLLSEEASGILNWMVEGYKLYMRDGLNPPESVRAASATMRAEADYLSAFVAECLVQSEGHVLQPGVAFDAWIEWTKDEPEARAKYAGKIRLSSALDTVLGVKVAAKVDKTVRKGWKGYTVRDNSATSATTFQDQHASDLGSYQVAVLNTNSQSNSRKVDQETLNEQNSKLPFKTATLQPGSDDTSYPTMREWYDRWNIPENERRV
jgi:P4 family phage/plasmid primase-like protien